MTTPDSAQGQTPDPMDDGIDDTPRAAERSRLEESIMKGSMWRHKTLRKAEEERVKAANESGEHDAKTARLIFRLTAQLDERNEEIDRMRQIVSKLQAEKSDLDSAHKRELEEQRDELARMQDAYDQFEKESDGLLAELSQQNESLRHRF